MIARGVFRPIPPALRLFLVSFAVLFLELVMIRWAPSNVRVLAYYSNVMLISSFLGIGIGCLGKGKEWPEFWFAALVLVELELIAALRSVTFAQGADELRYLPLTAPRLNELALLAVFAVNTAVFVPPGRILGRCFEEHPPLKAYGCNLAGNILGVVGFGLFSFFHFSPAIGVLIPLIAYLSLHRRAKSFWITAALIGFILFRLLAAADPNSIWSPYQHLKVEEEEWAIGRSPDAVRSPVYTIQVNTDFYMVCASLDPARYADSRVIARQRNLYLMPYLASTPPRRVLIVGAGGGMDVAAALLAKAEEVDAVEIDPEIIRLGKKLHPDHPYDDPRVNVIQTDARAFFSRNRQRRYDRVIFGLLDSHSLFSQMSNVRLDGFVYTVESFKSAYALLNSGGVMSVSFQTAGRLWLMGRLYKMLREATGHDPAVYGDGAGKTVFLVSKGGAVAGAILPPGHTFTPLPREVLEAEDVPPATDDWPYLYLRDRDIPADYLISIFLMIGLALFALMAYPGILRAPGAAAADQRSKLDRPAHFFFLGLSFMLLETKSITELSLLFGSTWLVSSISIFGVLTMIAASNFLANRIRSFRMAFYLPLFAAVLAVYLFPAKTVLPMDIFGRVLYAVVVVPLPIFFSGLIFSSTFREDPDPRGVLGANLIGATVGGFAEYLGMVTGFRALTLLVVAGYLLSALAIWTAGKKADA